MRLSVLDQSPVPEGADPADALEHSVALARAAEALGYERYWVAEHHGSDTLAGSSPEVLIAHLAARTSTIRVGSGGVMLSHYSPLKVAENFRVLHALHPGRIDLGIGRAPGSDLRTATALAWGRSVPIELFPHMVEEVVGHLDGTLPANHRFGDIRATPRTAGSPEVWLLGSSGESGAFAAFFGLPFSFAHFISPRGGPDVVRAYRGRFRPSARAAAPVANVGVSVICAPTDEEAEELASSVRLQRLLRDKGQGVRGVPSVERALAYPYTDEDRRRMAQGGARLVVGGPDRVRDRLEALAADYGVDELVVVTITHDPRARIRSYELLAGAVGLAPRPPVGAGAG